MYSFYAVHVSKNGDIIKIINEPLTLPAIPEGTKIQYNSQRSKCVHTYCKELTKLLAILAG